MDKPQEQQSANEIKQSNCQAINAGVQEIVKSIEWIKTPPRYYDLKERVVTLSLKNQDHTAFIVNLSLRGSFDTINKIGNAHLDINLPDQTGVAGRTFDLYLSDNGELTTSSGLAVFKNFPRIGIGTGLINQDEVLLTALASQLSNHVPIKKLVIIISDATRGADKGWTTRRMQQKYQQNPSWHVEGKLSKLSIPIQRQ